MTHPTGGGRAAGAMLVIHGGGWRGDRRKVIAAREHARRFARQGWLVWNIDYRSCRHAFGDVTSSYLRLAGRARRAGVPVCAFGSSAGGHMALLLAARRRPDCVISQGGPTDLTRLGPRAQELAREAFGDRLWEASPLRHARERPGAFRGTRILLGHRRRDAVVRVGPVRGFAGARPVRRLALHVLRDGRKPFVHGRANASDRAALRDAERALLRRTAVQRP